MSLLPASGIKPEPISWLWRDWLARGKMHIIAGQPGTGKTTLAMKMAATVSSGSLPPADLPEERKVIIFGDLSKRPQHECITLLLPYDLLPLIKVKNQLKNFALYQRFARFRSAFFLWREDNLKRFLKPDHWRCGNYKAGVKLRLRRIRCRLRRFASNECGHQSAREEK